MPTRLTNFNARIRADVVEDDGVEIRRTYEIEAELSGRRKSFLVPAAQFQTVNWAAENLGPRAIVFPVWASEITPGLPSRNFLRKSKSAMSLPMRAGESTEADGCICTVTERLANLVFSRMFEFNSRAVWLNCGCRPLRLVLHS